MPIVLATDTSTAVCSVALCSADAILAEWTLLGDRLHAERIVAAVDWVISQAGVTPAQIDLLAVAQGPGSFTGLRIGASVFKGLALAWQKPLAGISTLEALARLAPVPGMPICPLLDARMGEVYAATFDWQDGQPQRSSPDVVAPPVDYLTRFDGPVYFLGDGALRYADEIRKALPEAHFAPPELTTPRASAVGLAGLRHWAAGGDVDPAHLSPIYLRQSQAEMNAAAAASGLA